MKINYKNRLLSNLQSIPAPTDCTIHSTLSALLRLMRKILTLLIRKKPFFHTFCFQYYAQINTFNTVVNFTVFEKYQKLVVHLSVLPLTSVPLSFFGNGSLSKSARRQKHFIKPRVLPVHRVISEITHTHTSSSNKLQHQESSKHVRIYF